MPRDCVFNFADTKRCGEGANLFEPEPAFRGFGWGEVRTDSESPRGDQIGVVVHENNSSLSIGHVFAEWGTRLPSALKKSEETSRSRFWVSSCTRSSAGRRYGKEESGASAKFQNVTTPPVMNRARNVPTA